MDMTLHTEVPGIDNLVGRRIREYCLGYEVLQHCSISKAVSEGHTVDSSFVCESTISSYGVVEWDIDLHG